MSVPLQKNGVFWAYEGGNDTKRGLIARGKDQGSFGPLPFGQAFLQNRVFGRRAGQMTGGPGTGAGTVNGPDGGLGDPGMSR